MKSVLLYATATGTTASVSTILPRARAVVGYQISGYYLPTVPDTFFVALSFSSAAPGLAMQPVSGDTSVFAYLARNVQTNVGMIDGQLSLMGLHLKVPPNQPVYMHVRGTTNLVIFTAIIFFE